MIKRIKQILETPQAEYYCSAFLFHCIALLILALIVQQSTNFNFHTIIVSDLYNEIEIQNQEIIIPETEKFDDQNTSFNEDTIIDHEESSIQINNIDHVPSAIEPKVFSEILPSILSNDINENISGLSTNLGQGFASETSFGGALDILTREIMLSAEHKDTNVVWLFDASISMKHQRDYVRQRFSKILTELNFATTKHSIDHCIYSFGQSCQQISTYFSDNCNSLQNDIESIQIDESGIENTFEAIGKICKSQGKTGNRLIIIVFTDEIGDDIHLLDIVSRIVKNKGSSIFVVGSPAPFGRSTTQFKFVDFDPEYDQKEKWVEIQQGPENLFNIILDLKTLPIDDETLDSGFGPFGLSKLCLDSGGAFLSVHPNRSNNKVTKNNISPLSSYISRFFDHKTMTKYAPDYRSVAIQTQEYSVDKTKQSLCLASRIPLHISGNQILRFRAYNEAVFHEDLSTAQKFAAKIEPKINHIYNLLSPAEQQASKILEPRIIASYYLAMGRILATKCRIELYNLTLAQAKSGMKKKDPNSNTWILIPDVEFKVDNSVLNKNYQASQKYLKYVVENFPNTPWELMAKEELNTPMGYRWIEHYEEPPRPNNGGGGNNNPGDDKVGPKLIPKPQRKIDKI